MFAKLEGLEKKYLELEHSLAQPEVFNDQEHYRKLAKAHADLRPVVDLFRQYRSLSQELEENKQLLHDDDADIHQLALEEVHRLEAALPNIEHKLKVQLLPTDPLDEKNTILEIRAGTGGEEAALFAADLFRMYSRYAELKGWKAEIMSESPSESGDIKKLSALSPATGYTAASSLRPEPTGCSACPPLRRRAASTPRRPPWPSCPKPKRWTWKSSPTTCA